MRLFVYGTPGQLATQACLQWLTDNAINYTFIEATSQHEFVTRVPTLVMSDTRGTNLVYAGFDSQAKQFITSRRAI